MGGCCTGYDKECTIKNVTKQHTIKNILRYSYIIIYGLLTLIERGRVDKGVVDLVTSCFSSTSYL